MQYILIEFLDGVQGYQETSFGNVHRYTDLTGTTLNKLGASRVIDASPIQPIWALPDPLVNAVITTPREITKYMYMTRFTDAELATLYTAAKSVIQIEIWLEKFKLAEVINLDDPMTVAGLHALEASGLIAAGRAAVILNA
jgi:hypothetical protein